MLYSYTHYVLSLYIHVHSVYSHIKCMYSLFIVYIVCRDIHICTQVEICVDIHMDIYSVYT
jgi:hypothetical protein